VIALLNSFDMKIEFGVRFLARGLSNGASSPSHASLSAGFVMGRDTEDVSMLLQRLTFKLDKMHYRVSTTRARP
jgi:hypothetical protein